MKSFGPLLGTFLLVCTVGGVLSGEPLHMDTQADLEGQGARWIVGCDQGYARLPSDFRCSQGGQVLVPEGDLNPAQLGFWTACGAYQCSIWYYVQPGDSNITARIYQLNDYTGFQTNNDALDYITGNGWIDIHRTIKSTDTSFRIWLKHSGERAYGILDRFAVNAELPTRIPIEPPTSTTSSTTAPGSTTPTDPRSTTSTPEVPKDCNCNCNCNGQVLLGDLIEQQHV